MIFFLVAHKGNYFDILKEVLGNSFTKRVQFISYDRFLKSEELRSGTYIFCGRDRLSPRTAERAAEYWRELENSGLPVRLYNHPLKVMRRFELLRNLHDKHLQEWNVYRLTDQRWPTRYPVFLRRENSHMGPITGLISNRRELEQEIKLLPDRGYCRKVVIVVEFCDTKDSEGIYKKFGALLIGGKIIRRHIFFRNTWMIKKPDIREEKFLQEEMVYIQSNSHEEAIRKVFELARIDHGRLDYGMLDGKMQVWEINDFPRMIYLEKKDDPRSHINNHFYGEYIKALAEIDLPSQATFRPRVDHPIISFSRRLLQKAGKLMTGMRKV